MQRPEESEYDPYYGKYVSLVPETEIIDPLESQPGELRSGNSQNDRSTRQQPWGPPETRLSTGLDNISRCLRDAVNARMLARRNRRRGWRVDRGREQIASGGVDALLRRRRGRCARCRRRRGGRRRCRWRLIAAGAARGGGRTEGNEGRASGDNQHATSGGFRTHSQSPVIRACR